MDEPIAATASTVTRWLLVEYPPAWAAEALESGSLPEEVRAVLGSLWRRLRIRVVLVRRRPPRPDAGVRCFAAWTGERNPWVEAAVLADVRQLLDLDLSPLGRGESIGVDRHPDPLLLVCTHGTHDPCCGRRGRPVADELASTWPELTWECSHIGGDRFAGNLVCLPHGVYFGRLDRTSAPAVVNAYLEGRIDLGHYRGRTCYPFPVQAAEAWVRERFGVDAVDDLRLAGWDDGVARFELDAGRTAAVRVRTLPATASRLLTCTAPRAVQPPGYDVSAYS
ncbi:MAG: sucrase ferredoxin [Acidimicrobiales bacterium]